jgi:lipid-binding SYLF domain-containing protein
MPNCRPLVAAAVAIAAIVSSPLPVQARTAAEIAAEGRMRLQWLVEHEQRSRLYARNAKAVLIFPSIFKAGLVFGAESGNGVLLVHGQPIGYYNLSAGTAGLQIGGEKFSYAMFFMNDAALRYLKNSDGFAIGTGPSVAVINQGAGADATSTSLAKDVYAFPFGQKGLMADLTLQGSKISPIHPK